MDSLVRPDSRLALLELQTEPDSSWNDSAHSALPVNVSRRRLLAAAASTSLLGTAGQALAQAGAAG
jgi:hypothetical protein